jgi:hypothetical protein
MGIAARIFKATACENFAPLTPTSRAILRWHDCQRQIVKFDCAFLVSPVNAPIGRVALPELALDAAC